MCSRPAPKITNAALLGRVHMSYAVYAESTVHQRLQQHCIVQKRWVGPAACLRYSSWHSNVLSWHSNVLSWFTPRSALHAVLLCTLSCVVTWLSHIAYLHCTSCCRKLCCQCSADSRMCCMHARQCIPRLRQCSGNLLSWSCAAI